MNKNNKQITINPLKLATLLAEYRIELESLYNDEIDLEQDNKGNYIGDKSEEYFSAYYNQALDLITECEIKNISRKGIKN